MQRGEKRGACSAALQVRRHQKDKRSLLSPAIQREAEVAPPHRGGRQLSSEGKQSRGVLSSAPLQWTAPGDLHSWKVNPWSFLEASRAA
ncbi:hypothetical protein GDO81_022335 [Engystomops pustulosus]|uniref:Uncharacterized protein n=1 Tax=Engystomops pustulosus TaxID=76066 RepID=A0AAV6ZLK0_ENGPU|nr:hypothetical protein GDO81_022335 [Engystomops pustulosus]